MKLLGEFLLEQRLVPADELLRIYLEQIQGAPSLPELLHRQGLLSAENVLAAFGYMGEHGVDFRSACRELGLWKDSIQEALRGEPFGVRVPLCKLLLERKLIALPDLIRAMDDYLSEAKKPARAAAPSGDAQTAEYASFYDEHCRDPLSRLFGSLMALTPESPLPPHVLQVLQDGVDTLGALRGAARLAHAAEAEKLIGELAQTVSFFVGQPDTISPQSLNALGTEGLRTLEKLNDKLNGKLAAQKEDPSHAA